MDRKKKLLLLCAAALALVLFTAGALIIGARNKAEEPSPTITPTATPTTALQPTEKPTPTPTAAPATPTSTPTALPSAQPSATPTPSPVPAATPSPVPDMHLPQGTSAPVPSAKPASVPTSKPIPVIVQSAQPIRTQAPAPTINTTTIGAFSFSLPKSAGTGTAVQVIVRQGMAVSAWSVQKNGAALRNEEAFTGTLSGQGGFITFRSEGDYVLTAVADGKEHQASIHILAPSSIRVSAPKTAYRGTEIEIKAEVTGSGQSIVWSVMQNGKAAVYKGVLSDGGGKIMLSELGAYWITASFTDKTAGEKYTDSRVVTVANRAPGKPAASAAVTDARKDGKTKVEFSAVSADPDGDAVTLEWSGRTEGDAYPDGEYIVMARARDALGVVSEWTEVRFTVGKTDQPKTEDR